MSNSETWDQKRDQREALYERRHNLTAELQRRSIGREHWADIQAEADKIDSIRELDEYLDRMEAEFHIWR